MKKTTRLLGVLVAVAGLGTAGLAQEGLVSEIGWGQQGTGLKRIKHNTPGATAPLGGGLWGLPFPCDRNGDGITDLILTAAGLPKELYYFEGTGKKDPKTGAPLFKKPVLMSQGLNDHVPSYLADGKMVAMGPFKNTLYCYPDFMKSGFDSAKRVKVELPVKPNDVHKVSGRTRGNQYTFVDFYGPGSADIVAGIGDWTEYGWDNAYDENGRWTNGPLHGFVYIFKNEGTAKAPKYTKPVRLVADNRDVDLYGNPSPVFGDFRKTGKLDMICGEFVDGLTFFENTGTRENPVYAKGRRLLSAEGKPLTMSVEMIVVVTYDFDGDGLLDLVVAQEDGTVAWLKNTGKVALMKDRAGEWNMPVFLEPEYLRQEADEVKFGVLGSPIWVDWDGDGLIDIVTGNASGEVGFIKNLGPVPGKPGEFRWAEVQVLESEGMPIRFMAGYNGSIQGPCEAKWGYTNISVADWDEDGLLDIMVSDITGRVYWFKNIGTKTAPKLDRVRSVKVDWAGKTSTKPAWNWWNPVDDELVVEWRNTPLMVDLDGKGSVDLVSVDHEGYLALFKKVKVNGEYRVKPGERIFKMKGVSSFTSKGDPTKPEVVDGANLKPGMPGAVTAAGALHAEDSVLRMNIAQAGGSGRRTYCFTDWDGDGKLDLLVNSVNINFYKNVSTKKGEWVFVDMGPVDIQANAKTGKMEPRRLAGHSTCPTALDMDGDGMPDLLVGAEDGFYYYMKNPNKKK